MMGEGEAAMGGEHGMLGLKTGPPQYLEYLGARYVPASGGGGNDAPLMRTASSATAGLATAGSATVEESFSPKLDEPFRVRMNRDEAPRARNRGVALDAKIRAFKENYPENFSTGAAMEADGGDFFYPRVGDGMFLGDDAGGGGDDEEEDGGDTAVHNAIRSAVTDKLTPVSQHKEGMKASAGGKGMHMQALDAAFAKLQARATTVAPAGGGGDMCLQY